MFSTMCSWRTLAVAVSLSYVNALESFDYIIVGAGTSGLAIANRLSEDLTVTVAVIEPGTDQRNNSLVTDPTKFGQSFGSEIDWQYKIPPQPGSANRELILRQGKVWGGTSAINGMTYIRGDAASINAWETLGNTGWNWDTLLPYYKKSENFSIPTASQLAAGASYQPQHHGFNGHVHVGYTSDFQNGSFSVPVVGAWEELGLLHSSDLNSGSARGFGMGPQTLEAKTKVRWDAARAYYHPVEKRENLKIIPGTVKRIEWVAQRQRQKLVANAVHFVRNDGTMHSLVVKKEVILSAGAIRTPLILEGSGIGSPRLLRSMGIEPLVNLPGVGENLIGQTGHQFTYSGTLEPSANAYHSFVTYGDLFGNLTHSIERTTRARLPELARIIAQASRGDVDVKAITKVLQTQHDLLFKQNVTAAEVLTIIVEGILISQYWILQPFSRGSVHLKSVDAINDPLISPQYFIADIDLAAVIDVGKLVRRFWNSKPISQYVSGLISPTLDALPENATNAQWEDYLKTTFSASSRSLGTAAMMARELGGVVDPKLRVYGTENVRVVDASILPMQTSGHVTATLYAVAEKAAEIIKREWE